MSDDVIVLEEAFSAINNISLDAADVDENKQGRKSSRSRAVDEKAVPIGVEMLKRHLKGHHFGVLESICRALATLLYNDLSSKELAVQKGAPDLLLQILREHSARPALLSQALRALATIVANTDRDRVQKVACDKGAIEARARGRAAALRRC